MIRILARPGPALLFLALSSALVGTPVGQSQAKSTSDVQPTLKMDGTNLVDLNRVSIEVPSKKPTLVVFLSSTCPCSMSHIPELKALSEEFSGVQMVGVNSNANESIESAHEYFKSVGLTFPVIKDTNFKLADYFKASKTPHAFLLDSNGKTLFQGGVSNSSKFPQAERRFLREALLDVKNGSTVRTPVARALGCAINR